MYLIFTTMQMTAVEVRWVQTVAALNLTRLDEFAITITYN